MANNNLGQESIAQGGIRLDALFVFTHPIKGLCKAKSGTNQPPQCLLAPLYQTIGTNRGPTALNQCNFVHTFFATS